MPFNNGCNTNGFGQGYNGGFGGGFDGGYGGGFNGGGYGGGFNGGGYGGGLNGGGFCGNQQLGMYNPYLNVGLGGGLPCVPMMMYGGGQNQQSYQIFSSVKTKDHEDEETGSVYALNSYDCLKLKSKNSKLEIKADQGKKEICFDLKPERSIEKVELAKEGDELDHKNKCLLVVENIEGPPGIGDADACVTLKKGSHDGQELCILNDSPDGKCLGLLTGINENVEPPQEPDEYFEGTGKCKIMAQSAASFIFYNGKWHGKRTAIKIPIAIDEDEEELEDPGEGV